ncbi:ribonuclease HI family protein [Desulfobulbus alkaliphilus]|uniref:ribonuclease HI family protein n=1 Tax=Desulfobulbus alkaliphilus TaxID=869814 RepID=UPI001965FFC8|nr:ribonuclease HI family protein [Desulfobulbus alkaliphilus]MBM9537310.1 ribonuclease HI family protein [Desulfobulbus alkaliphilus]
MKLLPNNRLSREQVLQILADQLDDHLLNQLFPTHKASDIRQLLAASPEQPASVPPSHTSPAVPMDTSRGRRKRCRLFTDGASRGNPGQAGAGAVLLDEKGAETATVSTYLGICTNNVAEYQALLLGLKKALQHGCTELTIALDSELIVRQLQGRYQVKNQTLRVLFAEVQQLLARFDRWSVSHVPRAENARADQLANRGIELEGDQEYL